MEMFMCLCSEGTSEFGSLITVLSFSTFNVVLYFKLMN